MKEFSVVMSLVDYIPVALFTVAAVILMRDLYNKMSKGAFALFGAGTIDVVCAGFLKATYKLLYALGVCDFEPLSNVFFPMQSLGFMLAGIGMLALLCHKQTTTVQEPKKLNKTPIIVALIVILILVIVILCHGNSTSGVAPAYFSGTFVFVFLMILGLGFMDVGLCVMSKKLGKAALIALFVVSFFLSLCMGYLSSRDFNGALMNWIAELVNTIGQAALLLGAVLLHKNGLDKLLLRNGEIA